MNKTYRTVLSPGWNGLRTPRACVIGLGLIGGSWAGALARMGWKVYGVDCDESSLEVAQSLEWITKGWREVPETLDVDLIILALPLPLLSESLSRISGKVPEGVVVTDVGSIKTEVFEIARNFPNLHFIGGHPMAGSEKKGFTAAHPDLFKGYPYILTPDPQCSEEVIERFSELIRNLGAQVIFREHEEHDRQVALVSHVPHLLALALALSALEGFPEGKPLEVAGRSFRELTRLVDSSPEMWREILIRNAPAVLSSLEIWEEKIQEIRGLIEQLDGEGIIEVFEKAQQARGQVLNRRGVNE